MNFEWDENKRQRNIEKHTLDFLDAVQLFDGRPVVSTYSPRGEEERWATTGVLEGRFITVVWTPRGENTVRLISARRARGYERRTYCTLHGG
jgi:uncharacterized DUF497 family protein